MGKRLVESIMATAAVLAFSAVVFAQTAAAPAAKVPPAPRSANGKPDLSGVWGTPLNDEVPVLDKIYGKIENPGPMEMTSWAAEKFLYNQDPRPKFGNFAFGSRPELNPRLHCVPVGPTNLIMGAGSYDAFEIIQSPKRVMLYYQVDHNIRQVWVDGRKHPEDPGLTWMGHSIGHWDGDVLVVDTIGMRTEPWLDGGGHVHSEDLHLVERYKRIDRDVLEVTMTIDDPKALTKPWSTRMRRKLRPDWDINEDVRCYAGEQDLINQDEIFGDTTTQEK